MGLCHLGAFFSFIFYIKNIKDKELLMGLCHLTTFITLDGWRIAGHFEGIFFGEDSSLVGKGWVLVIGKGWILVIGKSWVLVVGKGWSLVVGKAGHPSGKTGRDVGVNAVKQELILLQVLTSIYTALPQCPRPSQPLGPRDAHCSRPQDKSFHLILNNKLDTNT